MAVFSKASHLHDIRFGTDGWRALIAKEFTYKNLEILLDGLATYILETYGKNKALIIGYDARFLADRFADFAAETINSWGLNVEIIKHPIPTPVIAYTAKAHDSCGALTFTASHNPPEYMGIKYIPDYAGPSSLAITNKILEQVNLRAEDPENYKQASMAKHKISNKEAGSTQEINPQQEYFNHVRKLVDIDKIKAANQKHTCKLVYDPLYGCGLNYTDTLLKEAGFDLITLHDTRDPTFGGSLPDPKEDRLQELKQTILNNQANLGAANDGDADRFAFMDEVGAFYPANKSLAIILKYLVEKRGYKGTVARTLATSHLFDELANKFGLTHKETPVGFKWLCEVMLNEDTVLAAEESGGMSILGHIPEKDGILAILLIAEILAVTGKTLSQLWQEVQDFAGKQYFYDRLDLHISDKAGFMAKFNDEALKEVAGFKVTKIDRTEGAKVYLDNGAWFLARPSGTEAMCRVYFEAHDEVELNKIVSAIKITV